jgi:hypothetical protein
MADISDINIGINVETGDVSRGIRMFDNMKKKIAQMQLELRKGNISNKAYNRGLAQMYQELGKVTGNTRQAQSAVMKYSRSIQEATDEQLRFTSVSGKGMRRMEVLAQQAGYQVGDLAVQIQGGTNAAVALGQQGSQLLGFFGPYGAIAGAALAIGTGLIAPFIQAGKEVEDFQKKATEVLEDIKARIAKLKGEDPVLKGYNESIAKSITQATTQLNLMNKIRESGKKLKQSEEGIEARLKPIKEEYLAITAILEKQQREKQVYLDTLEEEKTLLYEQDVLAKQREQRITGFFKAEQKMQEEIAQSRVDALLQDNKDRELQQKEDARRRQENAKRLQKIREERAKAEKKAHEVRMGYIALEARSQMLLGTAPMFMNTDSLERAAQIYKDRKAAEEAAAKGGPKAPRDALVSLTKNLELERELLGVEQDRASVLQALGESRNKYTEEQIQQAVNVTREIRVQTEALEKQKQVGDMVGQSFEGAFMSIVDGTKSVQDAFRLMAADIIKELYRIFVVKQITGMISGAVQGYMAGPVPSADGGGYTGSGSRSGGLDGKGGFMAMLHPRETVIDHTKGQSVGGGDTVTVNQTINVSTGVQQTVRTEIKQLMPQIAENAKAAVVDAKRRGGSYGRSFA